jgi:histone H1/5
MITAMIIVSISVALGAGLSGGGPQPYEEIYKHWGKAIVKYVDDDEREKQAEEIKKTAKKLLKETRKGANEALEQYFAVDQRYDATLEDYEAAITSLNKVWIIADKQLIGERFKMQEVLTEKEWVKCVKYVEKKMSKVRKDVKKGVKKQKKSHAKQVKKLEKEEKKAKEKEEKKKNKQS